MFQISYWLLAICWWVKLMDFFLLSHNKHLLKPYYVWRTLFGPYSIHTRGAIGVLTLIFLSKVSSFEVCQEFDPLFSLSFGLHIWITIFLCSPSKLGWAFWYTCWIPMFCLYVLFIRSLGELHPVAYVSSLSCIAAWTWHNMLL